MSEFSTIDACQVLIVSIAAWQAVEIWSKGKIFSSWHGRVEAWNESWIKYLLLCTLCMTVQLSLGFYLVAMLARSLFDSGHTILGSILYTPIGGLAASAIAMYFRRDDDQDPRPDEKPKDGPPPAA